MKLLLIPLVAYLAVVALLFVVQRSLLYLPGHRGATAAELDAWGLSRWPDAAGYRGYLHDGAASEATVVVFHGNAGEAIDRRHYVDALGFPHARVLLAEYPGYGTRPGRPSERTLVDDARETLALLAERFPDAPLYVVGESLGAGVAAAAVGADGLATPKPCVAGLLLLTPWDSLTAVAAHHYRFVPVAWLLRDRYASARHLAGVSAPKVVVVAARDEIVPAASGRALYRALPAPKRLVVVDAGHNDWPGRVDRDWWRGLRDALVPGGAASRGRCRSRPVRWSDPRPTRYR